MTGFWWGLAAGTVVVPLVRFLWRLEQARRWRAQELGSVELTSERLGMIVKDGGL